jgi:hypothetical protein
MVQATAAVRNTGWRSEDIPAASNITKAASAAICTPIRTCSWSLRNARQNL